VLVEIGRLPREAGRKGPDLMGYLDLVALATVADVPFQAGVSGAVSGRQRRHGRRPADAAAAAVG